MWQVPTKEVIQQVKVGYEEMNTQFGKQFYVLKMRLMTDRGTVRTIGSTQDGQHLTEIWNFDPKGALDFIGFFSTKDPKADKILSLGPIVDVCGRKERMGKYVFGRNRESRLPTKTEFNTAQKKLDKTRDRPIKIVKGEIEYLQTPLTPQSEDQGPDYIIMDQPQTKALNPSETSQKLNHKIKTVYIKKEFVPLWVD